MEGGERKVVRVLDGEEASDGAGVRLRRMFDPSLYALLDPFLLLDAFGSDDPEAYIAGFPDHPHRGFETVTYMLAGRMEHRDSVGNHGVLDAGAVQWMTAGSGIIHSEMPRQDRGRLAGFQLWVNLPAVRKMAPPRYQEFAAGDIAQVELEGGSTARLVAGRLGGVSGPVAGIATEPLYADLALSPGTSLRLPLSMGHTALLHVHEGSVRTGTDSIGTMLRNGQLAVLDRAGDHLVVEAVDVAARALLIAAAPIGEPVAHWGPFVMNTREEVQRAIEDYRLGRLLR